jgi:hypothetical protein
MQNTPGKGNLLGALAGASGQVWFRNPRPMKGRDPETRYQKSNSTSC